MRRDASTRRGGEECDETFPVYVSILIEIRIGNANEAALFSIDVIVLRAWANIFEMLYSLEYAHWHLRYFVLSISCLGLINKFKQE